MGTTLWIMRTTLWNMYKTITRVYNFISSYEIWDEIPSEIHYNAVDTA